MQVLQYFIPKVKRKLVVTNENAAYQSDASHWLTAVGVAMSSYYKRLVDQSHL